MSLSLDLSAFANKSDKKMSQIARRVFIDISTDVIRKTPVLTGRARSNWLPEINKFSNVTTLDNDKTIKRNMTKVLDKTSQFKLGDRLTLTNNLSYITALEYGHSQQSPSGMLRISFAKAQRWVKLETLKAQKITTWST